MQAEHPRTDSGDRGEVPDRDVLPPSEPQTLNAPSPPSVVRPYTRVIRVLSALAVVLAGVAVAIPVLGGRPPNAGAAVVAAVENTLGQQSSDVSMHATMSAGGNTVTITGSGQVDYRTHEASFDVSSPGLNGATVREVLVGSTMYVQMPGTSTMPTGKSWISVDLSSIPGAKFSTAPTGGWGATTDPLAVLPLLQKKGGTVVALGPSTQAGRTVQGYRVTFDRTAIAALLSNSGLPAYHPKVELTQGPSRLTVTLEVLGTGQLASMAMDLLASTAGTTATATVTLSFSTYGKPVTITPPPATQVLTFQQFVGEAGGSVPTFPLA